MNKKKRDLLKRILVIVFLATGGGCVGLNPDHFLPESIAPAGKDQRFDGSVNVQVVFPVNLQGALRDSSRGKFYLSQDGKVAIVPRDASAAKVAYARSRMILSEDLKEMIVVRDKFVDPVAYKGKVAWYHSGMLRTALEKSIARTGLFLRVEQGDSDYVLDVWVIDAFRLVQAFDEGMTIDMTAVWRLIRAKDGTAVVCDFVTGHGASYGLGTNAYRGAMEGATRDMIQKGLSMLSGRSLSPAVLSIAGDWPSMGTVVPEGHRKMKGNWSKLRKGMAERDVRGLITSMPEKQCSVNRYFLIDAQGKRDESFENYREYEVINGRQFVEITGDESPWDVPGPCGWNTRYVGRSALRKESGTTGFKETLLAVQEETLEPFFPFYYLTFIDGRLERWGLNK